jgi:hypothetical protein
VGTLAEIVSVGPSAMLARGSADLLSCVAETRGLAFIAKS